MPIEKGVQHKFILNSDSLTIKDEPLEDVMDILGALLPVDWSIREKDLYLERK